MYGNRSKKKMVIGPIYTASVHLYKQDSLEALATQLAMQLGWTKIQAIDANLPKSYYFNSILKYA